MIRLFKILIILFIIYFYTSISLFTQTYWDPQFANPNIVMVGADNIVCSEIWNNEIICGGAFQNSSGYTVNGIFRYNIQNNTFQTLGNGTQVGVGSSSIFRVNAIKADGNNLWVGGNFESAGGQTAYGFAKYDFIQNTWSGYNSLSYFPLNDVLSIGVTNQEVYIGGSFITAYNNSNDTLNYIVKFNKTNQQFEKIIGVGTIGANGPISAFYNDGSRLWVGGNFTNIAGIDAHKIAYLDLNSNTWHALEINGYKGLTGNAVFEIYAHNDSLYIGGEFTNAYGVNTNNFVMIDLTDSTVTTLGIATNNTIRGIRKINHKLYIGGWFMTPHKAMFAYNFQTNSIEFTGGPDVLDSQIWPTLNNLQVWNNQVLATGSFLFIEQYTQANGLGIYRPDANTWCFCSIGLNNSVNGKVNRIVKFKNNKIIVGGDFTIAGPCLVANKIAIYDLNTNSWEPLGNTPEFYGLKDIYSFVEDILVDGDDIYIAGQFQQAGTINAKNIVRYHYPTKTFHPLINYYDGYTMSLAKRDNWLYVGGNYKNVGVNLGYKYLTKYDLNTNQVYPAELNITGAVVYVDRLLYEDEKLFVAGYFDGNFLKAYSFAQSGYYGELFTFDLNINGQLLDLEYQDNKLYIAGGFDSIYSQNYSGVAIYDFNDHTFKPLDPNNPASINGPVTAIDYDNNRLYLAGMFSKVGNYQYSQVKRVAAFNFENNQWQLFGNENHNGIGGNDFLTGNFVNEISVIDGDVWFGGEFNYVNTDDSLLFSTYLARWHGAFLGLDEQENSFTGQNPAISVYPNPVNELLTIMINANQSFTNENYQLQILDITGKKIKQQSLTNQASNKFVVNLSDLKTGIYILQLMNSNDVFSQKIIKQ